MPTRNVLSWLARLTAGRIAALLLATTLLVLIRPSQAFVIIDLKSFFDPLDVAPGQILRARVSNLFAGEAVRARVELRSADDGSLIQVLVDGSLAPGHGMFGDVNGDHLPLGQRGIIAVLTLTVPSPSLRNLGGTTPASIELIDQATQRTVGGVWRQRGM